MLYSYLIGQWPHQNKNSSLSMGPIAFGRVALAPPLAYIRPCIRGFRRLLGFFLR